MKKFALVVLAVLMACSMVFAGGSKEAAGSATVSIGQAYAAAHGTKCFTVATVVVSGDVIVDSYIDDFQFTAPAANVTPVPNTDGEFGTGAAAGQVLISKRVNNSFYSANMASHAGATVEIAANFDAVQNYVKGKKIADVEKLSGADNSLDVVSGCTLVDLNGYLKAIVAAAKAAQANPATPVANTSSIALKAGYGAAHGDKGFTMGAVATDGTKIYAAWLDEFQFMGTNTIGVPNSDKDFGAGYAEGKKLVSKRVDTAVYSENMASHGGATVAIDKNYDAIQNYMAGKTVADLEKLSKADNAVDVVSGATLSSTGDYIGFLCSLAK